MIHEPLKPTLNQNRPIAAVPVSPLARAERSGVIDVLLVAVSVLQYVALRKYFLSLAPFLDIHTPKRPAWLIISVTITWGLLIAGALAPLLRRHRHASGELPRGSGPLLFTWAMMFVVWLALVFNTIEDDLWGFWHISRFENDSFIALASFLPLTLAPGLRRLYRAMKLTLLRRLRAMNRHRLIHIRYWPAFAIAGSLVYVFFFQDHAIMSDGWGMMGMARRFGLLEPESYREPLFMIFFREEYRVLRHLGVNIGNVVGGTSTVAMMILAGMIHLRMRRWNYTRPQMIAGWMLMLSTLGMTQMFLGHIELYPLLIFGLGATFHTGLDAVEHRCSPAWPAIIYALTLAGHLSAIFVLPAVLLIYWLRATPPGKVLTPVSWPVLVHGMGHLLGWGLLIHGSLWLGLMVHLEQPTPQGLVGAVTGSLNTGAEHLTFIGSNAPTLLAQAQQILTPTNLFKMVQAFFYLAGGPLLACMIAVACRMFGWRAASTESRPDPKSLALLWTAFLCYGFYALTWNNDWTWLEDWDLFSGIAPLALLLAIRLLMPLRGVTRLPFGLLATSCYFALVLSVTQHQYNHSHATYLGSFNKFDYSRVFGETIQRMQLEREYPRFTSFHYIDGRIVVKIPVGSKMP